MPFHEFGLEPAITTAIRNEGYLQPTPIQQQAIPEILAGRDVVGIAQTGTGKTAAFVLPILNTLSRGRSNKRPRALVLAPTRELALQVEESVRTYGKGLSLRLTAIYGGVSEKGQIQAVRQGVDIIVATPGRLEDLLRRNLVDIGGIELLVLDEADRMLDIGFLPAIRRIVQKLPTRRQSLLFSATFSPEIEKIAQEMLRDPVTIEIGARSRASDLVDQFRYGVVRESKIDVLLHILKDESLSKVLVFSRTKHGADKIHRKLSAAGISCERIHSNRTQAQRTSVLDKFKQERVRVLIGTDVAARGIDVDGISHVINFDFPPQPDDYIHRIGRTGRAEVSGIAISFVTFEDESVVRRVEKVTGVEIKQLHIEGLTIPPVKERSRKSASFSNRRPSGRSRGFRTGRSRSRP